MYTFSFRCCVYVAVVQLNLDLFSPYISVLPLFVVRCCLVSSSADVTSRHRPSGRVRPAPGFKRRKVGEWTREECVIDPVRAVLAVDNVVKLQSGHDERRKLRKRTAAPEYSSHKNKKRKKDKHKRHHHR